MALVIDATVAAFWEQGRHLCQQRCHDGLPCRNVMPRSRQVKPIVPALPQRTVDPDDATMPSVQARGGFAPRS